MPGMNAIRLATNASPSFTSSTIRVQAVRDELITIFVHVATSSGAMVRIRGGPDDEALTLGAGVGMVLHTIITTGTAGTGQTKIDGSGFASVTLQTLPCMLITFTGGFGGDVLNAWLIE